MENELNALEREVMEMLLIGEDPILSILREQYKRCNVKRREMSGVGFFTYFAVPDDAPRANERRLRFGDVVADIDGLTLGAGFVLFVDHGCINFLEGYCYEESWPEGERQFSLRYESGAERNLDTVRQKWSYEP